MDKTHVLSPGYMSTIGGKVIMDCPGCLLPCQFGAGCAKRKDIWLSRMHCESRNKVFVKPPGPCLLTIKSGGSRVISSYFDSTI